MNDQQSDTDLQQQIEADAMALAQLIYDIYQDKKQLETSKEQG
jgi:hypothetical protein